MAFGVAAGLGSWLVGESALERFKPKTFTVTILLQTFVQPTTQSQNDADFKNATLAFAILGGVTGLAMGVAGGLAGRSPTRGAIVGLGAAALGGVAGALASRALLPLFYRSHVPDPNDLMTPFMVHGGIWMAVGAVGGAAFGAGLGSKRHIPGAIVGSCVGAALAAIVFHTFGENVFPDSGTMEPNARSSLVRLLARLLVTVLVAAGAVAGTQGRATGRDLD